MALGLGGAWASYTHKAPAVTLAQAIGVACGIPFAVAGLPALITGAGLLAYGVVIVALVCPRHWDADRHARGLLLTDLELFREPDDEPVDLGEVAYLV